MIKLGCIADDFTGATDLANNPVRAGMRVVQVIHRYDEAGRPIRAVMLARLGPNVWHDSPAAAMATQQ